MESLPPSTSVYNRALVYGKFYTYVHTKDPLRTLILTNMRSNEHSHPLRWG